MASSQSTGMPPASKRSSSPALGGPMPTPIEENKSLVRRFTHAIEGDGVSMAEIVADIVSGPPSETLRQLWMLTR